MNYRTLVYLICFVSITMGVNQNQTLPDGFVYAKTVIADLDVELRYFSTNNFVGDTIDDYKANRLILTKVTTEKLKLVQVEQLQEK